MAEALPYIMAASTVYNVGRQINADYKADQMQKKLLEENKPIGWDEALTQAQQTLNPIYDKQIQQVMKQSDKDLMARGFYGQMPGDVLSQARQWDVQRDKAGAVTNLAKQTQSQSQANAMQAHQLAAQYALGQGAQRLQAYPQILSGLEHGSTQHIFDGLQLYLNAIKLGLNPFGGPDFPGSSGIPAQTNQHTPGKYPLPY